MGLKLALDDATTLAINSRPNSDSVWQRLEELQRHAQAYVDGVLACEEDAAQVVAAAYNLSRKALLATGPKGGHEQYAGRCAFVALMVAHGLSIERMQLELPELSPESIRLMLAAHNGWLGNPSQHAYRACWQYVCNHAPAVI